MFAHPGAQEVGIGFQFCLVCVSASSLKTELVHHQRFATREQAKREITEYIEIFYNRIRKQARLGYLSPAAFSQQYYAKQITA